MTARLAALDRDGAVDWLLGVPLTVLLVFVVALLTRWVLVRLIRRVVRRMAASAQTTRLGQARRAARTAELTALLLTQRREQRAEAIGQLLTSAVSIVVWVVALLTVLPVLGVNIAPLLASAGVLGVALGIGAQTLVKDYLTGVFLILEDQFGVGDVVDLGTVVGTVEEVSLRVTRLRDMSGVVWYVRNGEILRVANRSQGWTMATVDLPIAYDEDLDRVRALVEAVAEDMDSDPAYDDMLLGRPSYAGVEGVAADSVTIRVTAKAAPEETVALSRVIRERIKVAFDRAGVRMPATAAAEAAASAAAAAAAPAPAPAPTGPGGTGAGGAGPGGAGAGGTGPGGTGAGGAGPGSAQPRP